MSEPVEWLPDGTPYSPRFGDRYHSENGGLTQARQVFLHGCGLPAAWAGQTQWRILETGFGFGLNFLVTWAAWRADPARCTLLHFVSTEAWPVGAEDLLRATSVHPELAPLARELHAQWWGLLPGVHRLSFEGGRVLLTLYVGDTQAMLRQQMPAVDAVYLDGFSPQRNPEIWDSHTLKAVARCCRRGTRLATWTIARAVRDALAQCGFEVTRAPGVPPKRDNLHATYNPHWEPRTAAQAQPAPRPPGECFVIGGGVAGAATAASLARRGWRVQLLDQGDAPAAGASGLPAGVFAPHVSPDDSLLSRLSRSGVRATLTQARALLREGLDFGQTGVLERHAADKVRNKALPASWADGPGADWSQPASDARLAQAQLPAGTPANWHPHAGWLRPARLVGQLLAQPGITWHGGSHVSRLQRKEGADGAWQALDATGRVLAEAPVVVIAAGADSRTLLNNHWPLQALRGQVSVGTYGPGEAPLAPFPLNGNGNLVPDFPLSGDGDGPRAWIMGSTFERGLTALPPTPAEQQEAHTANFTKMQGLLPPAAERLQADFAAPAGRMRTWAAVRCTLHDRLPVVGPVDAAALPGLWACTAMGARGLTLSVLCGELLAARMQGEPLPLDAKLAKALGAERLASL
ncbi:tRNA 5-methylaminomethyl-2-thiouridine biosynthesis bifunctional protein [Acidovorax soli]|uniref:tRNA 5-methylaminomethyl-2-thiouridine biosynthesis bifunctional protein MnmC n=1 Tax=Acidovorax soli TaxID=592050 RepID=A0A7X0PGN4_9BURK|nr:FAD-dependent 5-carboxymethylaminomethyl-2-thiouridine(34) oxidoreductase MnmC [Acidovorax soli]MBB6561595.1 tRNA 5-methylaminomethyl-2-thiouridine biosynthesis bifunctional protein [Acidovorax soli]